MGAEISTCSKQRCEGSKQIPAGSLAKANYMCSLSAASTLAQVLGSRMFQEYISVSPCMHVC